jgi:Virulence factor BrkB
MPRRSPGPDATVPPSMLWPLLCSALLVGIVVTGDVIRAYSRQRLRTTAHGTGAFGAARSTDEPRGLRRARAGEPGRGRHARAPWHIPWKGWKDIFWRTYQQIGEDRLLAVAAGVVFYGLLAVFPAVTALVSLYGLFASPAAISDQLALLSGILPDSAVEILREQIGRLTANTSKLGLGFIFGLAIALWSANSGMKAIMDALNVVYEEKEKRMPSTKVPEVAAMLKAIHAGEDVDGGRGDACLLWLPGGTLAAHAHQQSARAHSARDQAAHARRWCVPRRAAGAQSCRGPAAAHCRYQLVDQTLFEYRAAEGAEHERCRHRVSQCRAPLSPDQ